MSMSAEPSDAVRAATDNQAREGLLRDQLPVIEAMTSRLARGGLSPEKVRQLALLALSSAVHQHDFTSSPAFDAATSVTLRMDLHRLVSAHTQPPETPARTPGALPPDVAQQVDVHVETNGVRVTGLAVDDLVRRLRHGHAAETRLTLHEAPVGGVRSAAIEDYDLSPREVDIICRVAAGLSNREVAADLFLGINTIKTYIRTAYRKMGVTSRSQAVMWAVRHGLGPDGEDVARPGVGAAAATGS